MKSTFAIGALLINLFAVGCGLDSTDSTLAAEDDFYTVPTLESVEAVKYSYPLPNNASRKIKNVASYIPGATSAMDWVGSKTNTKLEHEDVMLIKKYSDGSKLYESAGWGKKFPRKGEVSYFKKLEQRGGFTSKEKRLLSPREYDNSRNSLAVKQSKYKANDYRVMGDWFSGGWNCQTMASDVWQVFDAG